MLAKVLRRLHLELLPNIIGAQGLLDARVAKQNCLPYVGAVGLCNLGDEVLLDVARRSFPMHRLVTVKHSPMLQRMVLDRCIRMRLGILVGGGTSILSDSLLLTLERSVAQGIPFLTFGSGVHDPTFCGRLDDARRKRWLAVFRQCVALGVRGPGSKRILNDLGVLNVRIVGDPATLYAGPDAPKPREQKILGVNIGTAWGQVWGNQEDQPILELAEALRRLAQDGWRLRFFCVWPYDLPVIHRVIARGGLNDIDVVEEYFSGERFIEQVSTCRVFVGMKLHAVVLSICAGIPSLALEYRPKLTDYMASIQSESEVLRFDQYDAAKLTGAIEALSEQAEDVALRQWGATRELARRFSGYVTLLKETMREWRERSGQGLSQDA